MTQWEKWLVKIASKAKQVFCKPFKIRVWVRMRAEARERGEEELVLDERWAKDKVLE